MQIERFNARKNFYTRLKLRSAITITILWYTFLYHNVLNDDDDGRSLKHRLLRTRNSFTVVRVLRVVAKNSAFTTAIIVLTSAHNADWSIDP